MKKFPHALANATALVFRAADLGTDTLRITLDRVTRRAVTTTPRSSWPASGHKGRCTHCGRHHGTELPRRAATYATMADALGGAS